MRDIFSRRFEERRKAARLSHQGIAKVCKNKQGDPISRQSVIQWEAGTSHPSFGNLVEAARVMNTSIDYLAGLSDHPEGATGLSDEALELARVWDDLTDAAKEHVLHALEFSKNALKRKRTDILRNLIQDLRNK